MSDLKAFSDALAVSALRRQEERKHLNELLGEPAVFVPDQDDERFGTGYWKANGGVVSYRRYCNGYDPFSRVEYTNDFIDILNKVRT